MKIIDHHNSVQEEPFSGNFSAGENKKDSDLVNITDSTNTQPESISGEENIQEAVELVNSEEISKSPASGKAGLSEGQSTDGEDTEADARSTGKLAAGNGEDPGPPTGDETADHQEQVAGREPAPGKTDASHDLKGSEPAGMDSIASEPADREPHVMDATDSPQADREQEGTGSATSADTENIISPTDNILSRDTDPEITETGQATTGQVAEIQTGMDHPAGEQESSVTPGTGAVLTGDPDMFLPDTQPEPESEPEAEPGPVSEHEPEPEQEPSLQTSSVSITPAQATIEFDYSTLSRQDLVNRLKELINNQQVQNIMSDVDHIKLNFYKKFKLETEQKRKKYVEDGGNIEDFQMTEDPLELQIKDLLKSFRSRKSDYNRNIETEKHDNLRLKYEVIEKIKDLVNRKESINKTFQEFRELQKEWRSIGLVPQASLKDLWDNYNYHVEKFYDYIKINKELRDLDLRKNLEAKIRLCEKAEGLLLEPSVLNAFKSLQKFHDQWREIGPVPTEKRSEIWDRFREATYKINKKHQQHFEDLKNAQKRNLEQKRLLCEKTEEINQQVLSTQKQWDEKSKELIELQKVWRTIGFAPKKDNNKIYMRFREACDTFFNLKRDFYNQNKEIQLNNLQMKTELCMQAELFKESSDWKKTTEELIHLQKKWKEIGPVPKKYSEQIWRRFRAACDYFFEQKTDYFKNIDKTYETNLQKKDQLIKEIEKFVASDRIEENFRKLNEFQRRWTEIGFVPFENKEELQERYRVAVNRHFDSLKIDENQKSLLKFQTRLDSIMQKPNVGGKLQQEREKCVVRLQQLNSDIVLWENNIGFFTKSKNAESMIRDINNKINNTRETIRLLEAKITMIDNLDSDQSD